MKKRVHIIYSGMVQGVGFRFTAERIAASLGITGWVRNVPYGTVEVVAEGNEEDLIDFMDKIKKALNHYIRGAKTSWHGYTGEFDSFGIRFH